MSEVTPVARFCAGSFAKNLTHQYTETEKYLILLASVQTLHPLKIFISYSRFDIDIAKWIEKFFIDSFPEEYEVFRDTSSIPAGQRWTTVINQNIPKCDFFVVIITETSLRSLQVSKEVAKAIEHGKPIIPCKFEDLKWKDVRWKQQGDEAELTLEEFEGIEFKENESLARDLYRRVKKIRNDQKSRHVTLMFFTSLGLPIPLVSM